MGQYLRMALPTPLYKLFDYLPADHRDLQPGIRIKIPFGRQTLVGVLVDIVSETDVPLDKLRPISEIIDEEPLISAHMMKLCQWASDYYHYPLGEVLALAMPTQLRQGEAAILDKQIHWQITELGLSTHLKKFKQSPSQQSLMALLQATRSIDQDFLTAQQVKITTLKALEKKGYIEHRIEKSNMDNQALEVAHPHPLNQEQLTAVNQITTNIDKFSPFLLQGITGSGKTEVYLHAIEQVLIQGRQALVLIPEIGLTPQTLARFAKRFKVPIAVLHSGLNPKERAQAWLKARGNYAKIIIGTRSAIFAASDQLGIIIIDESHDLSFKQQDGFRYSARDLAVRRAQMLNIPIVLGTATPSFESLHNINAGRFTKLALTQRAGNAKLPQFHLINICDQPMEAGLSPALLKHIKRHIDNEKQVLLFLNRRGYAPTLICNHCGYVVTCNDCSARMTLHLQPYHLHCHHCDKKQKVERYCPKCQSSTLNPLGQGTEKVESVLGQLFPGTEVIRVDRDTANSKNKLENLLNKIQQGNAQILIGTQMLAKGHHFPNLTCVAILDVDSGLLSPDFRSAERMAQLLVQVAGRAGREEEPGEVYLQTRNPEHPGLLTLLKEGYFAFADLQLAERQAINFPPYAYLAIFRCDAVQLGLAMNFLSQVKAILETEEPELTILGPIAAPMERRKGFYRAQLLLNSNLRKKLQHTLKKSVVKIDQLKKPAKLHWSLDIDPLDLY